jgi:hypothetical protein
MFTSWLARGREREGRNHGCWAARAVAFLLPFMPAYSLPEDPGRAKRWGTTPYIAQLLANTVGYYRDTDAGKNAFRKWYAVSWSEQ